MTLTHKQLDECEEFLKDAPHSWDWADCTYGGSVYKYMNYYRATVPELINAVRILTKGLECVAFGKMNNLQNIYEANDTLEEVWGKK